MAYYNKYKFTFATKSGKTAYLYLQEDLSSAPSVVEFIGVDLKLGYIPQSDDPFDVIYASQLSVSIDVTDDTTGETSVNIPNFTTLNDRKYFAKLYLDTDLQWVGWTLSDNITMSFTTGRKILSFNCIDGLGLLQSIKTQIPSSTDTNAMKTLLFYVLNCLNSLSFPSNPNVLISCNYFASGMTDRGTSSSADPFNQTYLPARTFLNDDYTFLDAMTVLKNILYSFGCKIFMANGKWNIVQINQYGYDSKYYTEYDYTGSVVASGILNNLSTIQGYTGNTSGVYFVNNSQVKIMRKGYNKINVNHTYESSSNYISNGNLRPTVTTNNPYNWFISFVGGTSSVTLIDNPNDTSASFRLFRGTGGSDNARVWIASQPNANYDDKITISFDFHGQATIPTPYVCAIYLTLTNGGTIYTWDGSNWVTTGGVNYRVPNSALTSPLGISNFSFTTKVLPISGNIAFKVQVDSTTDNFIQVSDFKMEIKSTLKSTNVYGYINSSNQYVNNITLPYGFESYVPTFPSEKGIFLNSSGAQLTGWYQYCRSSYTYGSVSELLMQSYINVFGKNIINVDCDLSSINTSNGYLNALKVLKINDLDPSQINVSSNHYMLGNCNIDIVQDIANTTLLQVNDDLISATVGYTVQNNT